MEQYIKLGIEVFGQGDYAHDLPKWAGDDNIVGEKEIISSGGNNWYSMPLSSIDAIQLAGDCADYAASDDIEIDAERLAEVLQHDDSRALYEEFYS